MTVIYDELSDFNNKSLRIDRDARDLFSSLTNIPYEQSSDFIKKSISESLSKYGSIRESFLPALKNWTWERLPLLTQAILIMSYAHYYYVEKVEKSVVIDIAVKLAKQYIDLKQAHFINAILDGVLK